MSSILALVAAFFFAVAATFQQRGMLVAMGGAIAISKAREGTDGAIEPRAADRPEPDWRLA